MPATPPRAIVPRYVGTTITEMRLGPYCKPLALGSETRECFAQLLAAASWLSGGRKEPAIYSPSSHHLCFATLIVIVMSRETKGCL